MKEADEILDIGPMAGIYGGEVVFQGNDSQLRNQKQSLTAQYLTKERVIPIPATKRKPRNWIKIIGARENNLQNVSVDIPLFSLLCVTGRYGMFRCPSLILLSMCVVSIGRFCGASQCLDSKNSASVYLPSNCYCCSDYDRDLFIGVCCATDRFCI
jgi:hypothetical protein